MVMSRRNVAVSRLLVQGIMRIRTPSLTRPKKHFLNEQKSRDAAAKK